MRPRAPCDVFCVFAYLLLASGSALAATPERPITLSVHSGVLVTDNFLRLLDGWHPVVNVDLQTDLRPWLGSYVHFGTSPVRLERFRRVDQSLQFFTAGIVAILPLRSMSFGYKLGYGAMFTRHEANPLFAHGLLVSYAPTSRWRMEFEVRHLVPNDWFEDIGVSERYGSLSVTLGWGVSLATAADGWSRRDTEVSALTGILITDRLLAVRDGTYGMFDVMVQRRVIEHLGYYLEVMIAPITQFDAREGLLGGLGGGLFWRVETSLGRVTYRVGYGVVGDPRFYTKPLLHGVTIRRPLTSRLGGRFDIKHLVPDTHRLGTVGLSVGVDWRL